VRSDTWRFGEEGGVDIGGHPADFSYQPDTLAQEFLTVGISKALIVWWKVLANIAQRGRAEDGVGDSVEEDVGIGVPLESPLVWDFHPTERQSAPLCEAVDVVANPDAGNRVLG
jgi:hypothetical protein